MELTILLDKIKTEFDHVSKPDPISFREETLKAEQEKEERLNPVAPYIRTAPSKPYTLVLDMDETLVHF